MKFKKNFPTLAKVHQMGCKTFTDKCLMKTCLDKNKVKEAIDKVCDEAGCQLIGKLIKKELGLE